MKITELIKTIGHSEKQELPTTLSGWLELSLEDVQTVLDAGGSIDMNYWVNDSDCSVCLAGAVMVCEFPERVVEELNTEGAIYLSSVGDGYSNVFRALNSLRSGWIQSAVDVFYGEGIRIVDMPGHCGNGIVYDWPQFKVKMQAILAVLKERGL